MLEKYPEISSVGDRPDVRPGIVHRLDRETSGVLMVARNQKFFSYFKNLLKEKKVEKKYLSLVFGKVEKPGKVDKEIGLKPNTIRRTTWVRKINAKMVKSALTEYVPVKVFEYEGNNFTLVELYPRTGRTHQLRVHMESIGRPIVGDKEYGPGKNPWGLERQFRHASSIEFVGLKGEGLKFEAPLPKDLANILEELGA